MFEDYAFFFGLSVGLGAGLVGIITLNFMFNKIRGYYEEKSRRDTQKIKELIYLNSTLVADQQKQNNFMKTRQVISSTGNGTSSRKLDVAYAGTKGYVW